MAVACQAKERQCVASTVAAVTVDMSNLSWLLSFWPSGISSQLCTWFPQSVPHVLSCIWISVDQQVKHQFVSVRLWPKMRGQLRWV